MTSVVRCLNTAGALVLDINTGVYEAVVLPGSDETWNQQTIKSWTVDGHTVLSETLDGLVFEVQVRIRGASWPAIETSRSALKTATSGSSQWLLQFTRGGVTETWRADRASSKSPQPAYNVRNRMRDVFLSIPVQPTPAITGI